MTTRRGLLAGILAAGFAPAAIGSGVLMPVRAIVLPKSPMRWMRYDPLEDKWLIRTAGARRDWMSYTQDAPC